MAVKGLTQSRQLFPRIAGIHAGFLRFEGGRKKWSKMLMRVQ